MRTHVKVVLAVVLTATALSTTGCMIRQERLPEPDVRLMEEAVPLAGAQSARVRIQMGAGELTVNGSELQGDLLSGKFLYEAEIRPQISTETEGGIIDVTIDHPSADALRFGRGPRNSWDIELAQDMPMELHIQCGAGESHLSLWTLDLEALRMELGAGDVTVDFAGPENIRNPKQSERTMSGQITAGAGEITVRLPEDRPVRVFGRKDGIGDWRYDGFIEEGDYLVNEAYRTSSAGAIELDIQRGVGQVDLELVD